jgi:hypothetical protein
MTQDQTDDRAPAPSFTPASATRADLPRQTEFRLVSPAPPEAGSAATAPTMPTATVPGQVVRDGDDDDRAVSDDRAGTAPGGNRLAEGEELMPGAGDRAEDSAPEDTAPEDSAPEDSAPEDTAPEDTAADDYPAGDSAARDRGHSAAGDGTADDDLDGDAERLHGAAEDAGPLAGAVGDGEPAAPRAGHAASLLPDADDAPLLSGVEELRAGWQRARIAFVDNPRGAVAEAAGLADEAAEALAAALRERRHRIRATWDGDGPARDTEALRLALLRYQALFAKIVGD